jgi:hypothetical protein
LASAAKLELLDLVGTQAMAHPDVRLVLTAAISDLGAHEEPPGSNMGPQIRHLVNGYSDYWAIPGRPQRLDWCAMAVSQWIRIGLTLPEWRTLGGDAPVLPGHPFGRWFGGVRQLADWADGAPAERWWRSTSAAAGLIFLVGESSSTVRRERYQHTGMIVADEGVFVRTIEGNTSHAVSSLRRRKSTLTGLIRWWL